MNGDTALYERSVKVLWFMQQVVPQREMLSESFNPQSEKQASLSVETSMSKL